MDPLRDHPADLELYVWDIKVHNDMITLTTVTRSSTVVILSILHYLPYFYIEDTGKVTHILNGEYDTWMKECMGKEEKWKWKFYTNTGVSIFLVKLRCTVTLIVLLTNCHRWKPPHGREEERLYLQRHGHSHGCSASHVPKREVTHLLSNVPSIRAPKRSHVRAPTQLCGEVYHGHERQILRLDKHTRE